MPEGAWVHYGLTSSDVVDTALCYSSPRRWTSSSPRRRSCATRSRVARWRPIDTPIVGRTHGMHAEPTTYGAKFALFALQVEPRHRARDEGAPRHRRRQAERRRRHVLQHRSRRRGVTSAVTSDWSRCPRPRSSPATVTPRFSTRAPRSARPSSSSPSRCATSRAAKWARWKSPSPPDRRVPRRCRTSAIPSSPSDSSGSPGAARLSPGGSRRRRPLARARHLALERRARRPARRAAAHGLHAAKGRPGSPTAW